MGPGEPSLWVWNHKQYQPEYLSILLIFFVKRVLISFNTLTFVIRLLFSSYFYHSYPVLSWFYTFLVSVTYCEDIVLNHGQINQTRPISVGQSVHVTCNHGYQLSEDGVDILRCEEPGSYDHNIPTCTGKTFSLQTQGLFSA